MCNVQNMFDVLNHDILTDEGACNNILTQGAVNCNLSVTDNGSESCNIPNSTSENSNTFQENAVNSVENIDVPNPNDLDPYKVLANFYKINSKNITFSHLNINSLTNKFPELHDIFRNGACSIIFLSETKIDPSFPNAQFTITNYCLHRQDRNIHGGGLLCYVHQMLPHRNRQDIAVNSNGIESIVIHVKVNKHNLFFIGVYKPPNINNAHLKNAIEDMMNKCYLESEHVYIIGDMNINFMKSQNVLTDTLTSYDLKQVIKNPTCFKSIQNPTLIDIILTSKPKLMKTINIPLGISDFHNYIGGAIKIPLPNDERKVITYRSFKKFNDKSY